MGAIRLASGSSESVPDRWLQLSCLELPHLHSERPRAAFAWPEMDTRTIMDFEFQPPECVPRREVCDCRVAETTTWEVDVESSADVDGETLSLILGVRMRTARAWRIREARRGKRSRARSERPYIYPPPDAAQPRPRRAVRDPGTRELEPRTSSVRLHTHDVDLSRSMMVIDDN